MRIVQTAHHGKDNMTKKNNSLSSWWGKFDFTIGQSTEWQVGPLLLIVRRLDNEWQFAFERDEEFEENTSTWNVSNTDRSPESLGNNSRHILGDTSGCLTITPRLADRPIISRPLTPFNLGAGEKITLYVGSPLWLDLAIGTPQSKSLKEIAIQRPSDTWFRRYTV